MVCVRCTYRSSNLNICVETEGELVLLLFMLLLSMLYATSVVVVVAAASVAAAASMRCLFIALKTD